MLGNGMVLYSKTVEISFELMKNTYMKSFLFPEADTLSEYALWWFVLVQFCSSLRLHFCIFVMILILENPFTILLLIPLKMPCFCNETWLFQAWAKQQQSQETVSMCTEGDSTWCLLLYFFSRCAHQHLSVTHTQCK